MTDKKKSNVPANVKQPTDHKPKAEDAPAEIAVELEGREWVVDARIFHNFRLLDDLNAVQHWDDFGRVPSILRRMLGSEGSLEALDYLEKKHGGFLSHEDAAAFIFGLFEAASPSS